MPKPVRKPPGAKEGFGVPPIYLKCGAGVLIAAAVIGLSHVLSPNPDEVPSVASTADAKSPAVIELNDTTFESFVNSHPDGVMVDFYSPSCSFCAKLAPEFESAAQQLKQVKGAPPFASVDSVNGPNMMMKYGIERYPTVFWFWKGENMLEFQRAAEKPAAKIVDWAKWTMTPAVQDLDGKDEFMESLPLLRSSVHANHRLIVAFANSGFEGLRDAFEAVAQRYRATTVFLFIKEGSSDGPMLKAFGIEESQDHEYEGPSTAEGIHEWVKSVVETSKAAQMKEQVENKQAKVAELAAELDRKNKAKNEPAQEGTTASEKPA